MLPEHTIAIAASILKLDGIDHIQDPYSHVSGGKYYTRMPVQLTSKYDTKQSRNKDWNPTESTWE